MRFIWLDTETTGLETTDSAAFEVAFILVDNGEYICERCFFLNPLNKQILYHEEAGKIHGYSEADIRAFPDEKEQVPKIARFLNEAMYLFKSDKSRYEKLALAGYNVEFDKKHLSALLERNGYKFEDYFSGYMTDVYMQVKNAGMQKALPYLPNRKLGTVAKHLGVKLENAHDALADIKATREVARKLHAMGVKLL